MAGTSRAIPGSILMTKAGQSSLGVVDTEKSGSAVRHSSAVELGEADTVSGSGQAVPTSEQPRPRQNRKL